MADLGNQSHNVTMKTISAAEFKARCLALLDTVDEEGLVITKRGKPVATLFPAERANDGDLIRALKGKLHILGDIEGDISNWPGDAES
jgi:prevent-host-death family protein